MGANISHEIMVIEDDKVIRESISYLLEAEGYQVRAAENGLDALTQLKSKSDIPCLILLDVAMPIMDGFQFRNEQLKDAIIAEIPVVVITADGNAPQKAQKMGAKDWIRKPLEIIDVLNLAEKYC